MNASRRRVCRQAAVADLLGPAERLDAIEELVQALAVGAQRLAVDRELADLARLGVLQAQVARQRGIELPRVEQVDHVHLEPALEQRPHTVLEAEGIHQVRDEHGDPGLARPHRVVSQAVVEARAAARPDSGQEIDEGRELAASPRRRPALAQPVAQDGDPDTLEVDEAHEAERGRQAHGVGELRRAPEVHRARGVDEEMQAEILLVDEELDVQAVEAAEHVPVDVAQVVADAVRAVVAELDAVPLARAAALATAPPAKGPAGGQGETLELREEVRGEEGLAPDGGDAHRSSSAWK